MGSQTRQRSRRERRERRSARATPAGEAALAMRAALEADGGATILLGADGPSVIAGGESSGACAALLKAKDAGAASLLAALRRNRPHVAEALAALAARGEACDLLIVADGAALRVAGRSAGALAWLVLTPAPASDVETPPASASARENAEGTTETGLLDALADAVALFGADRRLAWCNIAFAELWSLEPAWLADRPSHGEWLDRLRRRRQLPDVGDYAAFKAAELARHAQPAAAVPAIWRLPDERTLRVASQPRAAGGLALMFSDMTRELGLTGRLNQLVQVQRATLDKLSDAVAVFAADGRLTLHNEAFERLWAIDASRIAERPDFDGVVELCVPKLHDLAFWRDLKGRITDADPGLRAGAAGETRLADGRWITHRSRPLPDGATLVAFADVSGARALTTALADREAALAETERLRKAFAANVSYELRTPLTTVLGYCDLIERGGRLADPRDRAGLAAMRAAAGQLAASIDDVLAMAELDAGELVLELEAVDVAVLLAAARDRRIEAARAAGVELRVEAEAEGGGAAGEAPIRGDPRRLAQVLDHLIDNALRHAAPGCTVGLRSSRAEGEVRLAVADDGRGLAFDVQAHVFDRFGVHGMAGLGLPLVKAMVELHGGWVALESEPGRGSVFTCHLPETVPPSPNRPELFDPRSDRAEAGA